MEIQLMSRYGEDMEKKSIRDMQQKRNTRGEKDNNQSWYRRDSNVIGMQIIDVCISETWFANFSRTLRFHPIDLSSPMFNEIPICARMEEHDLPVEYRFLLQFAA